MEIIARRRSGELNPYRRYAFLLLIGISICLQASRVPAQILLFCTIPCVVDDEDAEATEAEKVVDLTKQFTTQLDIARTAISSYNASVSIYSATLSTAKTTSDLYESTVATDTAPTKDYTGYTKAGFTAPVPVAQPDNTYSNVRQWYDTTSTGSGASASYQAASVPAIGLLSGYQSLRPDGQNVISSTSAAIDINDVANVTALQTLGTIRSNSNQRETDISSLEAAIQSTNSGQQTLMSALHLANEAVLLRLRAQQDELQLQQASGLVKIARQMQIQNQRKISMDAATNYEMNYKTYMTNKLMQLTGSTSH